MRTPITTLKTPRLDYMWYKPTIPGVPQANFRIAAAANVKLTPGKYVLRTISDDAIRVWVDDKLVIDSNAAVKSAWDESLKMVDTGFYAPPDKAGRLRILPGMIEDKGGLDGFFAVHLVRKAD